MRVDRRKIYTLHFIASADNKNLLLSIISSPSIYAPRGKITSDVKRISFIFHFEYGSIHIKKKLIIVDETGRGRFLVIQTPGVH